MECGQHRIQLTQLPNFTTWGYWAVFKTIPTEKCLPIIYVCAYHDKSVSITCTVATIHKSNWCAKACDMWWHLMTKMLGIFRNICPGWWFGTFFIFHNILGIIIPTDFHIFQRGWNHHDVQSEVAWALLSSLPAWQGAIGAVTWEGIAFRVFQHTGWSANLGETLKIPWFIMINHCTIWIATWGYINISHYCHTQPYLKPKPGSSLADWPLVWPFAISCSIHTLIGWTLCSHDLTCEYAGYSSIGEDTLWLVVWNIFYFSIYWEETNLEEIATWWRTTHES